MTISAWRNLRLTATTNVEFVAPRRDQTTTAGRRLWDNTNTPREKEGCGRIVCYEFWVPKTGSCLCGTQTPPHPHPPWFIRHKVRRLRLIYKYTFYTHTYGGWDTTNNCIDQLAEKLNVTSRDERSSKAKTLKLSLLLLFRLVRYPSSVSQSNNKLFPPAEI